MNRELLPNLTIKLLKSVGSPFCTSDFVPKDSDEAVELYNYAVKNKIGLIYLESLKNKERLEESGLLLRYEEERKKYSAQFVTVCRISELFNSYNVNYAVFKSILPFPAIPNDTDIIHFGSHKEFREAVNIMTQSNYVEVRGHADTEQSMFHDAKYGGILDPHPDKKDIYDIDLYQKVSASYIIYLDKNKLEKYITNINMSGNDIKILKSEVELMIIINHSIIPEMLCTLLAYYATLYYIARMDREDINRFISITKNNDAMFSVRAHCSLVAELHRMTHGFIPEKIEEILAKLGKETRERELLLQNNLRMPHRYSSTTIIMALLEKIKDSEFRNSVAKQIVYMLNPKLFKWVVYNIIWRRRRDTY